jgi:hypothetical protein
MYFVKHAHQKIIFPENKANNSTYRHQKQPKSWQRSFALAKRDVGQAGRGRRVGLFHA